MSVRETVCKNLHTSLLSLQVESMNGECAYYRSDKNRYALPGKAHLTPNQK